jgi:hypothetical protein
VNQSTTLIRPNPQIFASIPFVTHRSKYFWSLSTVTQKTLDFAILNLTFICSCIVSISLKYNQEDAKFSRYIYFYKLLYMFQAVSPLIIRSTKLYIQRQVLSDQHCCLPAGSSVDLTTPDAVCTIFCSWWWAEESSETYRIICRNK